MPNFLIDEDTGLLAAEFVLGTLDSAERANAHSLLKVDHGFIAMVRIWERRFGDLHLMVEPVEPDAKILDRIKAKLPVAPASFEAAGTGTEAPKLPPLPSAVEPPKSAIAAETGTSVSAPPVVAAETPKPPEPTNPPEPPKPPEALAKLEPPPAPAPPVETAAPPSPPPVAGMPPSAESPPPEEKLKNGRSQLPKAGTVPLPPPPPSLKPPDKAADRFQERIGERRADRRQEVTVDVIRSRRRWRVFGIFMILVALSLVGLVGAWRIAPDRLPPMLQPAAVMMVIGIQPSEAPPPARREAPPESQFDE